MLWVLPRISGRVTGTLHFGVIAFAGLVANPLLASAIGLEGCLYALLLLPVAPLAAMAVRDAPSTVRRAIGALALYGVAHFGVYALLGVPIVVCGALGAGWLVQR